MKKRIVILLSIIIAIILAVVFMTQNKSNTNNKYPNRFVLSESNTESQDYLPILDKMWLTKMEAKYKEKKWDSIDNLNIELKRKLGKNVFRQRQKEIFQKKITRYEYLNELTKEQRMYISLIRFEDQVKWGGVYVFLVNFTELIIVVYEGMLHSKMEKLASSYKNVLFEIFGEFQNINELKDRFQRGSGKWNKDWHNFLKGSSKVPSTKQIDKYFNDDAFKQDFENKMIEFVKNNKEGLLKIQE